MDKKILEFLVCPYCKSKLLKFENIITCKSCNKQFKYFDTYIDFIPSDTSYWGEIPYQKMVEILKDAKDFGYIQSKLRFSRDYPQYYSYLLSSRRIDFIFHGINFDFVNRYLDIGSGFGTLPLLAIKFFNEVYSLESGLERVKFQAEMKKQELLKNFYITRANTSNLPFKTNFFDFIAVNGVLEWIGLIDQKKNTKKLQIKFLKDLHKILKPNGVLYIGIENRFDPAYVFGKIDHSGYKFINLLPRFLANLIIKVYKKPAHHFISKEKQKIVFKKYSTYTYTFMGYKELLKRAGFNYIDIYRTPKYNDPKFSTDIKGNSFKFIFKEKYYQSKNWLKKTIFLLFTHVPNFIARFFFGFFSPCYLIFAYKSAKVKKKTFEWKILRKFNLKNYYRRSGVENLSGKIAYFLGDNKIRKVLKFSRFKIGENNLKKEEKLFERYNEGIKTKKFQLDNRIIYIEPYIEGKRCQVENFNEQKKAIKWLLSFQLKTERDKWKLEKFKVELDELKKYLKDLLEYGEINEVSEKILQNDLKTFYDLMGSSNLNICSEHGDFCKSNILLNRSELSILDFEYFEEIGNPVFDFCFFLIINSQKGFKKILTNNHKYSQIMKKLITFFIREKKIHKNLICYGFPYTLIRTIYRADPIKKSWYHNYSDLLRLLKIWVKLNKKSLIF